MIRPAMVSVMFGEIGGFTSDCLITPLHAHGRWVSYVDGDIQRYSGDHFHSQAALHIPFKKGEVIVATGNTFKEDISKGRHVPKPNFRDVLFVVDNGQMKVSDIVYSGLTVAAERKYERVTLPAILRTPPLLSCSDTFYKNIAEDITDGLRRFLSKINQEGSPVNQIIFIVPIHHQQVKKYLDEKFASW